MMFSTMFLLANIDGPLRRLGLLRAIEPADTSAWFFVVCWGLVNAFQAWARRSVSFIGPPFYSNSSGLRLKATYAFIIADTLSIFSSYRFFRSFRLPLVSSITTAF